MDYVVLADELTVDPLVRSYSGMNNVAAAADLNSIYRTRQREQLDHGTIYNSIDATEFGALTAEEQQEVWDIVHVGGDNLWVGSGHTARNRFVSIFGTPTTTITALLAAITEDISRAEELGLGTVKPGHVEKARAL